MRRYAIYWLHWLQITVIAGALALVWLARPAPLQPAPWLRVDALSAFFVLLTAGSLALERHPRRPLICTLATVTSLLALSLTPLLLIGLAYAVLALLAAWGRWTDWRSTTDDRRPTIDNRRPTTDDRPANSGRSIHTVVHFQNRLGIAGEKVLHAVLALLPAVCLLLGYGVLVVRGTGRYDERMAGAALHSLAFWFVLLAATIPLAPLEMTDEGRRTKDESNQPSSFVLRPSSTSSVLIWLYPLVRLYSFGPWNTGWSFAALLLGGAVALWATGGALLLTDPAQRATRTQLGFAGLALAGFALGTGAGLAAGCYCALVATLLRRPTTDDRGPEEDEGRKTKDESNTPSSFVLRPSSLHSVLSPQSSVLTNSVLAWLLSTAFPFTAPFVAIWLLIGAATASGVVALAGVAWLAGLFGALTLALHGPPAPVDRRVALLSLGLGVGAPLVLLVAVEPLIEQLQGGLTPYGDIAIWPWVGVATLDAAKSQVAALPSFAVAGLMLVLAALTYLVARLRTIEQAEIVPEMEQQRDSRLDELIAFVRREVPWLGEARRASGEGRHIDGE